jgi:LysM repeat protein
MADESAEVGSVFMKKIGPLPVIAWAGIAGVVYYVVKKRAGSSAKTTTATAANNSGEPGTMGTDPAGNTGLIDPSTGYVYGTPSDQAALGGSGNSGSSGSGSGSSTTATYTTNTAWEDAAINYLVGLGVDPVSANSAIAAYLGSQSLSVTQQAEVNEAIQSLGAPPQPPSPAPSTPVVSPPGTSGGPYAKNPPTGLATSSVTATSASLKWNGATGAKGYTVTYQPAGGTAATESTSQPFITLSGLKPQTAYHVNVQATPADAGAGTASITVTTPYGATGGGGVPVTAPAALKAGQQISVPYLISGGKSMTSVAKQFGLAPQHLIDFNPGSSLSTTGQINVPYLVAKGDTLDSIAGRFGIAPEHLAQVLAGEGVV